MLYGLDERRKRQDLNEGFWDDFTGRDVLEDYPTRGRRTNIPAVNVVENDKEYVLELASPGMCKEDYHLEVENDILTISGESLKRGENEDKGYIRNEFMCSSFSRAFILPEHIESDNISASCSEGILTIHIPKKEEVQGNQRRRIDIS